ncbi:MAG TPA: hydrolase [Alphaproteobacteria bacterium]|nr:hydrolase [Alphaproteobacteria bacterium]
MLKLDPKTTALVLIDLQKGILARDTKPHASSDVLQRAVKLADKFRAAKSPVVLVHVKFAKDMSNALKQPVDKPNTPPAGGYPEDWSQISPELLKEGDIVVTKHQWGAFYNTDMDAQLRRRGIKTIVLGGIATNMGVESTARQAYEHGYEVVIVEDATTGMSQEMHDFAVKNIFPLLSRVVTSGDIDLG